MIPSRPLVDGKEDPGETTHVDDHFKLRYNPRVGVVSSISQTLIKKRELINGKKLVSSDHKSSMGCDRLIDKTQMPHKQPKPHSCQTELSPL